MKRLVLYLLMVVTFCIIAFIANTQLNERGRQPTAPENTVPTNKTDI